ncbi:hypothetical protein [Paracoccus yeei]|uniref:hypothetical protein n=1 Tax=Paracoccus yeei TaxID=147645 RepID=UPI003BF7ED62
MAAIVLDEKAKADAQGHLTRIVQQQLKCLGTRVISFRVQSAPVQTYCNGVGQLWCAFDKAHEDVVAPKYWNAFGFCLAERKFSSTAQVSVEIGGNHAKIAGFFAQSEDGLLLMHSGRLGGGKKGISRRAFLNFAADELTIATVTGGIRNEGIVVARINHKHLIDDLSKFTLCVQKFKQIGRNT